MSRLVIEDMEMLPRAEEKLTDLELEKLKSFKAHHISLESVLEEMDRFGYSKEKVESWIKQGRIKKTEGPTNYFIGVNPLVSHIVKNTISASTSPQEDFKKLEGKVAVHLLKAENESSVTEEGMQKMQEDCPSMTIQFIPGSTHCMHKTAEKLFLDTLSSYI